MKWFNNGFLHCAFLVVILMSACKNDDNDKVDSCTQGFDQQAMFQNIVDNIIQPAYSDLKQKAELLESAGGIFVETPTATNLENLQQVFTQIYLSWQRAAPYEFGPAETVFLRNSLNNFPVNTDAVLANIQSGTYSFDQPDRYDKGFPALDYLLFGLEPDNTAILAKYQTAADATALKDYLSALIQDIVDRVTQTHNGWIDGYATTFVSNTGTSAGTALSLLINGLNHNYELIKREKLGFPSGVLTSGFSNPQAVEAVYSQQSLELLKTALRATEQLYLGHSGLGLDDYLRQVDAAKDGLQLDQLIQDRFAIIFTALDSLDDPLSKAIEDRQAEVENVYAEVSRQVPHLKTSLASVLCVAITYIDNPSDSD